MARKPNRKTNAKMARNTRIAALDKQGWRDLDALPAPLRRMIWEAPVSIGPSGVRSIFATYGEDAPYQLAIAIRGELRDFADQHRARYGHDLPHRAADATLQRYETKQPSKRHLLRPRAIAAQRRAHRYLPADGAAQA